MKTLTLQQPNTHSKHSMNVFITFIFAAIFADALPEVEKSALAIFYDQYNLIINTLTVLVVGGIAKIAGKWITKKFDVVNKTLTQVLSGQEKIADMSIVVTTIKTDMDVMKKDVAEIKKNTSQEIHEMKQQFLEVLQRMNELERKIK